MRRIAVAMAAHGADGTAVDAEVEQMGTRRIAPTANRRVVGIMNEFIFLADHARGADHARTLDLDELTAMLARTPCSPLYRTHVHPEIAFRHVLAG